MSDDGADRRRKRRSLRVPVDEVPRPTAPPEAPVDPQPAVPQAGDEKAAAFDGTATVEMPAFIDDDDDGLVASWMTPSSASPRTTLASPPPSEIEAAVGPDSDPVALASVEVELDSGLQALDEEPAAEGPGPAAATDEIEAIAPPLADEVQAEAPSSDPAGDDEADGAESAPSDADQAGGASPGDDAEGPDVAGPDAAGSEEDSDGAAEDADAEPEPAVVTQVVVQRVVSVAVGEPAPTPPEVQEPEPEFEEPDIIVDEDPDGEPFDYDDDADGDELDSAELDAMKLPDGAAAELPSDEVELDDEPISQEIIVDEDDDDEPVLTTDTAEDDDDEPSIEASEITEAELAEELPEEEGDIEELDALELDESAAADAPQKPPAPPEKPPPPPPKSAKPASPPADKPAPRRKKARKKWFEELFNDDYLRTVPVPHPKTVVRQCDFIEQRLGLSPGATILDVGCGLGLHAVELTRRGYLVVGLDLSLPMLSRAADEAQSEGFKINFLHADMREMNFEGAFDAVLCWNTTFGYFDDDTNKQIIERLYKALKPRGLLLLDVVNRDYVIQGQPNLVWFEGDGAVVMEETKMNYITSRLEVKRTVILDNGRQRDSLYSLRLYSVHELGQLLHHKGFRVVELTGREAHPGVFFGAASPRLIILAERRASTPARPSVQPPPVAAGESTPPPKPEPDAPAD